MSDREHDSARSPAFGGADALLALILVAGLYRVAGPIWSALAGVCAAAAGWWWILRRTPDDGLAGRKDLDAHLTHKAVIGRGATVRPSLQGTKIELSDVGADLGRSIPGRVPLAVSAEDSVLVLAAPRQGKTSQVAIPWLRSWPGPALVTSIRPDVLLATVMLRRERGPVAVLAPTGMLRWPDQVRWSPTRGCRNLDTARRRAEVMVTVGGAASNNSSSAEYFAANAVNLLTLWLHAAAVGARSMREVLTWSLDERDDTPITLLAEAPDAAPGTAALLDGLYRTPPETRSGLWTTVQTALAPLLSPIAQSAFCSTGADTDLTALLKSNATVYLLVPDSQAAALAPLVSAFVDDLIDTAKAIADGSPGGRLDPPLALILDEIANVVPLPSLPSLMSYAGGSGIFITAILQSRAQAEARFGRSKAQMLWGSATVKLILGGLSGAELRDISELAGSYEHREESRQRHADGSVTVATSRRERRTLTPEAIRTLDASRREALVLHATTPAVKIRMTRHYDGPDAADYARADTEARAIIEGLGDAP